MQNKLKMKEEMKKIIKKELKYWQEAYPEQSNLLERFAMKIYLELSLQLK